MTIWIGYYALACLIASIGWIAYRALSAAIIRRREVNARLTELYDDDEIAHIDFMVQLDYLKRLRAAEGAE